MVLPIENKPIRVGVNLTPLNPGSVGGIMPLVLSLLDGLNRETDLLFTYFVNNAIKHLFDDSSHRIRVVSTRWQSNEIENHYRHGEFDVLFAPLMNPGVETACCPMVVLLVDLQHRSYPENFNLIELRNRAQYWEWPARAAQTLCVISEFVAEEAETFLGIPRDKIILTPPILSQQFLDNTTGGTLPVALLDKLPLRYLLYPANTWPHKNHLGLLKSLAIVRKTVPDLHLVFTGWEHKAHKELIRTIKNLNLENAVTWLGYVDEQYMPILYRRARGLVFPSYFEGFGIPLIEAMASDCPIACSDRTSLPEVAGDSAIYFNPEIPEEIAAAMQQLWQDDSLCKELVEKGRSRLSNFNKTNVIPTLADALRKAPAVFDNPNHWSSKRLEKKIDEFPLVSIIVPSYQQSRFLRECIDSILEQDYPSMEVVIIDGGSTDGSVEILKSYGNDIYWISEPDDGQADAINKGLSHSSGEIIGWLNSDDLYRPGAILAAVTGLLGQSGCWLVYGEADYIDKKSRRTGRYPTDTYSLLNLLQHCCICQPSVFFDRRLLDTAGNLNINYDMALDYELWLRYSRYTPFLYLPVTLAASRMYPENKTSNYRDRSIKESIRASKLHYGRTSILWCMQYANQVASKFPLIGGRRKLRAPVQILVLSYALLRHMTPYWIFKSAQYIVRTMR
jgi:glycosyltransferase involved in cell wall biosynthesis